MSVPWYAVAIGGVAGLAALWLLFRALSEARDDAVVTAELIKAAHEDFGTPTAPVEQTATVETAGVLYTFADGATLECIAWTRGTRSGKTKMVRKPDGELVGVNKYGAQARREGIVLADFTCD